ncbi:unnamed protein product [Clavelina lepadiformis]|uniref:Adenosine 3'-phospho 5'-phosphosulfate transporter 1 n=1 Tax=Clavelina lepadiformis TaxID=159417 RepID=A0ABP0GKK2_CLALP
MKLLHAFALCALLFPIEAPPVSIPLSQSSWHSFWLFRLTINLIGYSTVLVPAYFLIQHLKKIKYNETGSGICFPYVMTCVFGRDVAVADSQPTSSPGAPVVETVSTPRYRGFVLLCCAAGLQASYLTWGVIQERIMTREYGKQDGVPGEKFTNSQFLVFVNRLLALTVAGIYITVFRQPKHSCPLYRFSFASFSNIMSSWFQYEALKFVSFPTQVLGKACKVIPVMLMGKVVSGNIYEVYEWVTAGMLSVGISLFLLSSGSGSAQDSSGLDSAGAYSPMVASFSGLILMLGYMAFDSFTSNWQGKLFKVHKMSSIQMMFGVNLFSCIFTSCSLLEQGGFFEAFAFMMKHWDFAVHSVILSICSAVGQLFIFYTISEFGAVIFTIIMTLRQAFAILLSCFIYGHPVGLLGIVGILVVFIALFLRIYARSRKSVINKTASTTTKV